VSTEELRADYERHFVALDYALEALWLIAMDCDDRALQGLENIAREMRWPSTVVGIQDIRRRATEIKTRFEEIVRTDEEIARRDEEIARRHEEITRTLEDASRKIAEWRRLGLLPRADDEAA